MRVLFALLLAAAAHAQDLSGALSRLSEEADVYARKAPNAIAEETLEQGAQFGRGAKGRWRTRQIVSEYTVRPFGGDLHELRKTLSVDGRLLLAPEKARHALSLDMKGSGDRIRKRLLEDFKKHTLAGAAIDFAPMLVLFTRRRTANYEFAFAGTVFVGAEAAQVIRFRQKTGVSNFTIFEGRRVIRQALEGDIVARQRDGLPLRIVLRTSHDQGGLRVNDEGTVDYAMTPHGFLAPLTVVHRTYVNGRLTVEDLFHYSAFHLFGASTEIKFNP